MILLVSSTPPLISNFVAMTSRNTLVHQQVAIGVPSPAGPGGSHHQQNNSNSNNLHGAGYYHRISPLTASTTPSPYGAGAATVGPSTLETSAGAGAASISGWSLKTAASSMNILLRALILLSSFASALSLAAPQGPKASAQSAPVGLLHYKEFKYCVSAAIIASVYSAVQLFKGICDISFKGAFISDKASDYISFTLDQFMAYLLMSSSSVCILATTTGHIPMSNTLHVAAIVATTFSFAACLGFIVSALLSGYRLCTRIVW